MKIKHDTYGEVDGVELVSRGGCIKIWYRRVRGRTEHFYSDEGWEEVPDKQWVEVPPNWAIGDIDEGYALEHNRRLRCVERYDLPEDVMELWLHDLSPTTIFWEWVKRYRKPCLIVVEELK